MFENTSEIRRIIKLALIRVGIRCDLVGFSYLCSAIELVIRNPKIIHNLCKGVYVQVGKEFDAENDSCVERSIRHAIENTYLNKNFTEINHMFHTNIYTVHDKPTAGELIRLMAEYYNLGLYREQFEIAA